MNLNIWGHFQICSSVPLTIPKVFEKINKSLICSASWWMARPVECPQDPFFNDKSNVNSHIIHTSIFDGIRFNLIMAHCIKYRNLISWCRNWNYLKLRYFTRWLSFSISIWSLISWYNPRIVWKGMEFNLLILDKHG